MSDSTVTLSNEEQALADAMEHAIKNPVADNNPYTWPDAANGSDTDTDTDADTPDADVDTPDVDTDPASDPAPAVDPAVTPVPDPAPDPTVDTPVVSDSIQITEDFSIPSSQASAVRDLYNWAATLSPEATGQINSLLSGEYVLVPRNAQPDPVQGGAAGGADHVTHGSPPAGSTITVDEDEYLDPRAAQDIASLRAELAAIRQSTTATESQLAQQRYDEQQHQLSISLDTAKQRIATQYELTDAELTALVETTTRMQITPSMMSRHPHDPTAGFAAALDTAYYADPTFRERELARQFDARLSRDAADAAATSERKRRAGSLTPSGAPVPRESPAARRPRNAEEQLDAMTAMIESANGVQ